jgi:hypothetical protein
MSGYFFFFGNACRLIRCTICIWCISTYSFDIKMRPDVIEMLLWPPVPFMKLKFSL